MNHLTGLLVLALTLMANDALASESRLGIYGDRDGTLGSIELRASDPAQFTRFYLVASNHTAGLNAFAYGLEAPELDFNTVFVVGRFSDYGLIDTDGCQYPFESGCSLGVVGCPVEGPTVMMGYVLLAIADAPEDALVCLAPVSLSVPPEYRPPLHVTCDQEIVEFMLEPNPCYDVPAGCLVVNPSEPCGVVEMAPSSWGAVKELF